MLSSCPMLMNPASASQQIWHRGFEAPTDKHSMHPLKRPKWDSTKTPSIPMFWDETCLQFLYALYQAFEWRILCTWCTSTCHSWGTRGPLSFTENCQSETNQVRWRKPSQVHLPNTCTTNKLKHPRRNTATLVRNGFVPKVLKPCNKLNCHVNIDENVVNCELLVCFCFF